MTHAGAKEPALERSLSTLDATVLVVSNVVGVGIFLTPAAVAGHVQTPAWYFGAWACGGLIALAGALSYAELGAALPEAGGEYVYLRRAYGPLWGFLHAWCSFLVTFSGAIAAIAVGLAEYLLQSLPWAPPGSPPSLAAARAAALAVLGALTLLNCAGVKASSRFQNALTAVTIASIVLLLFLGFAGGKGQAGHLGAAGAAGESFPGWAGLGAALVPIFFAYAGWNAPTYVAGEIALPQRAVPRALALGTGFTMALYLALNALFVYAFPLPRLKEIAGVGEAAARALIGPGAATAFAGLISLLSLGTLNVTIMAGARIPFAAGRDQGLLPGLGALHPRFGTPARALALQAAWAGSLVLTGTFRTLVTFSTMMMVILSGLTVAGVFVLRGTAPELARPYRTWGFPVVPALYLAACAVMAAGGTLDQPAAALAAVGLMAAGVPAYYWRARSRPRPGA